MTQGHTQSHTVIIIICIQQHIVQGGLTSLKLVTMKTICGMISLGFWRYEKYEFQNTFHQPFWRYGNPDMLILGTLKIKFQFWDPFE